MRKIIALFLIIIMITLPSCGNDSGEITEVRIAYFPNITHAQALIMKSENILEDKLDIGVRWIAFNAGPAEIEAFFAGQVDIGYIGPVPAISGFVQSHGDLLIIAGATNGGSVLAARSDADIKSAADLDGKTIAVPQFGNTQHLSLLSLLTANNLKPSTSGGTVNIVQSSNADIANLMAQKNIDAALIPEPWGSILEINHGAEIILNYDEINAGEIPSTAVVIVRKEFLENHRDIVEKFMEAHKEATLFINNNDVKEIINAQIYEVTKNAIAENVIDSALRRLIADYKIPEDSIMDFAKISEREKFIPRLPAQEIFYDGFVK
jgi:NitT/TauT family transport system substrate-binding protein